MSLKAVYAGEKEAIEQTSAIMRDLDMEPTDGLWPVFLSQEDINTLFFCMGTAYDRIHRDAVNRIGQRLSPNFVPYETGLIGESDGVSPPDTVGDEGSTPSGPTK